MYVHVCVVQIKLKWGTLTNGYLPRYAIVYRCESRLFVKKHGLWVFNVCVQATVKHTHTHTHIEPKLL